jgi:hypothetical protein
VAGHRRLVRIVLRGDFSYGTSDHLNTANLSIRRGNGDATACGKGLARHSHLAENATQEIALAGLQNWQATQNIAFVKVRDLLGINLLEPEAGDPPFLTKLGTDEILLCDVIYCLIKPQADQQSVTDEHFGQALGGEAILSAQRAFYEELIDFFQKRGRSDRARAVATQAKMIEAAVTAVESHIEAIDIDATIRGAISGDLPGSSVSTPHR